jgi:hypothetical protein
MRNIVVRENGEVLDLTFEPKILGKVVLSDAEKVATDVGNLKSVIKSKVYEIVVHQFGDDVEYKIVLE